MNTHQKGQVAVLKVEFRAAEKGFIVSKPTIDVRYDLIIDDGKKLYRVQVKYGDGKSSHSSGSVHVGLRRWAGDRRDITRNYKKSEVDAVLVYLPKVDRVCWLGPKMFHNKPSIVLRIEKAKHPSKSINYARDYYW